MVQVSYFHLLLRTTIGGCLLVYVLAAQVLANLYPHRKLPQYDNSTHTTDSSTAPQQRQLRRVLTDKTNRPEQQADPGTVQQGPRTAKLPVTHQSSDPTSNATAPMHNDMPLAAAQLDYMQLTGSPVPLHTTAGGSSAVPMVATTDQLAALVTAATTAATKAVARTILHHSRASNSLTHGSGGGIGEGEVQKQQLLPVSSRLRAQAAGPSAAVSPAAPAVASKQQGVVEEEEHPRTLLPTQHLIKFASVGQGLAASQWYLQGQPAAAPTGPQPTTAPSSATAAADGQNSNSAVPVIKYPRIWVRPDEEQQGPQLGEDVQPSAIPTQTPGGVQLQGTAANAAQKVHASKGEQTTAAADTAAESTDYAQHSLRKRRKASTVVAQTKASAAIQADHPVTVDQAVQVQPATDELPAAPQPQLSLENPQQQQGIGHAQQPVTEHGQQLQQAAQEQVQLQVQQTAQQSVEQHMMQVPGSSQQQQQGQTQPPEPVVPSPVPLPPELHTAVERTLQSFMEPAGQYQPAAVKPPWQQPSQLQSDEATR